MDGLHDNFQLNLQCQPEGLGISIWVMKLPSITVVRADQHDRTSRTKEVHVYTIISAILEGNLNAEAFMQRRFVCTTIRNKLGGKQRGLQPGPLPSRRDICVSHCIVCIRGRRVGPFVASCHAPIPNAAICLIGGLHHKWNKKKKASRGITTIMYYSRSVARLTAVD